MSTFLSDATITLDSTTYKPKAGVVTVPDQLDGTAQNVLGLSRYVANPAPAQVATTTEETA